MTDTMSSFFSYLIWSDKSWSNGIYWPTGIEGILVTSPNAWAGLNRHDHPIRTGSGELNGSRNHSIVVFGGVRITQNTVVDKNMVFRVYQMPWNRYLSHKKSRSSTGSWGGDPYRTVRILCESGVRIKILESRSRNPNSDHSHYF